MKSIDLAIIVPTLNEELFVGKLLDSIAKQSVQPRDIIVVDAQSTDNTLNEIQKRKKILPNLRVFSIPRFSISRQENYGVRYTDAKHILFLHADAVLPETTTLMRYLVEVERKKLDVAVSSNLPLSWHWKDIVFFFGMNVLFKIMRNIWPMAVGINIYIRKDVLASLQGFDEKVTVGEDFELIQRAVKRGYRFMILDEAFIFTSVRRFKKEGRRKFSRKMIRSFWYVIRNGYRDNPVEYEYGKFHSV